MLSSVQLAHNLGKSIHATIAKNDTTAYTLTSDSKALRAVEEAPCWAGAKAAAEPMRARAASLNMVWISLVSIEKL